ncbi:MAG: hypothetical protein EKK34_19465 [Mycobacterium sp.]|nr:MAG: hypothetical protein EKK34_19465 [Mycobacterium sp.]
MKRDAYTFLSGSAFALAYAHAAYAVAASKGIMNEPVLLGRKWGVKFAWVEVALYAAISLALAYRGWLADSREPER